METWDYEASNERKQRPNGLGEIEMEFTKQASRLYVHNGIVIVNGVMVTTLIRIDGRDGLYRVDNLAFMGFEAIDNGGGFSTVKEAKNYAKKWKVAVSEQNTLNPKMED